MATKERLIRMIIEYEGTNYQGWQRQKTGLSIQQVLEEKVAIVTGEQVKIIGAGRTDAGVHALNQVAVFRTQSNLPCKNITAGVNSLLPSDIVIKQTEEAPLTFHPRKDARAKVYLYQIYNGPTRSAVWRNFSWYVLYPLDLKAMQVAASYLVGSHDFSSFCSTHTHLCSSTRTLSKLEIHKLNDNRIHITMEANGFLRYMARIITGTLVEVGRGKMPPDDIPIILAARNRTKAGPTAPAKGLFLKEVIY
ncbi:MAG: tRNA pseudouridine(38-40) synthase TruA [Syntrophales bacterium]|nr:tRNA pseudouridine(38-40) synthase TruA [Syntrophales bacterium]